MHKIVRLTAFAAFAALGVSAAQAQYVIDAFTEGPDSFVLATPTGSIEGQQGASAVPGLQRDVLLTTTANPFSQPIVLNITGNPSLGASFLNNGVGASAFVEFDYDGFDVEGNNGAQTPSLGGMNTSLAGAGAFNFNFLTLEGPITIDVTAQTYGGGTATGSVIAATSLGAATYSLNIASMLGSFNLADVDRLTFKFTPTNPSSDFALASITTSPVPEPASIAALAIGGLGLLRARRRRKVA